MAKKTAATPTAEQTEEQTEAPVTTVEKAVAPKTFGPDKVTIEWEPISAELTKKALQEAIDAAQPFTAKRTTLPILESILVKVLRPRTEDGRSMLQLSATNLEVGIFYESPLPALMLPPETDQVMAVPATLFSSFVSTLPADQMVKLDGNRETRMLRVSAGRSRGNLRVMDPMEFPNIPTDYDGEMSATVDMKHLRLLVDTVVHAASKDDARPVFTGVQLMFSEGFITAATADSYRLSKMAVPALNGAALINREILVPAKALVTMLKALPAEGAVTLSLDKIGTHVFLRVEREDGGSTTVMTTLIASQFPKWQAILPKDASIIARFDRRSAQNALRSVMLFSKDNANIVRVNLDPAAGTVTFEASADEIGDTTQVFDAEIEGDGITIILNALYFKDALNALYGDRVVLKVNTPQQPAVVNAGDGAPEQVEHFAEVVMPMHSTK